MRFIGIDVHRDFCEIAIWEDGKLRRHPRVPARRPALTSYARSLQPTDQVGLEATGNALAIARIIEPHVARVVIANGAALKGIGAARAKTDHLDARTLAQLLGSGFFPQIWAGDDQTRLARRRMSRRTQLVRERTALRNQIHAVLHRNLVDRPPASDLFGVKGLRWLQSVELPDDERETVSSCLRQLAFLDEELLRLDRVIAQAAMGQEAIRLLLTVPGVNLTTAAAFMAAVGDITRFRTPRQLVSYLGLDPRVRQSGLSPARTATSPSRARPGLGTPWSSPPGWSPVGPVPSTPSPSAFGHGAEPTWRPSPLPASWPCSLAPTDPERGVCLRAPVPHR